MDNGIYAKISTSKGGILLNLEFEKTPGTTGNFIALAQGDLKNSEKPKGVPYYDGLKFHRVIPDFMIQGGCPQGTGTGNPGYSFDDEFHSELKHDKPGVLSMANSGPSTNGSQFFITHVKTPWLDNKHTVFGNVVQGQQIVNSIEQDDQIIKIEIIRVGNSAEQFNAVKAFETFKEQKIKRQEQQQKEQKELFNKITKGYNETSSGLRYQILQQGNGKQVIKGSSVSVHYKGQLLDGTVFDSSYKRKEPIDFTIGVGQVIKGWDEGIQLLKLGDKARLVIPSNLAYGQSGAGGVIPPNATLIFDIEIMATQ